MSRRAGAWRMAGSLAMAVAGSLLARPLAFWTLRGLYQFGEWVGITPVPPAPGAALGGQVAGYNFYRPPAWWDFAGGALSVAALMAPVLAGVLWFQSRAWAAAARPGWGPRLVAACAGAGVAGVMWRGARWWLADRLMSLGEAMGGSVTRVGVVAWGPDGPFGGSSWADHVGNRMVVWGPWCIPVVAGTAVALVLHGWLRRGARAGACSACGYDRGGIDALAPCPECGLGAR